MRKAFLPTAHIDGIRDGKFVSWGRSFRPSPIPA